MARLDNKSALVTGAASGIGRATAQTLARQGARVLAVDIDEAGLATLSKESRPGLLTRRMDVTDATDTGAAIAFAAENLGGLHIVCNCAAVVEEASFLEVSEQNWACTLEVNLSGIFRCCQQAIPVMRRSGGGSIVNVGSIASVVAEEHLAAYCASKGGVLALTKAIALEHARDGIRANCVCPGMVDTPMARPYIDREGGMDAYLDGIREWQPLGLGTPEQIASVIAFVASDDADFMTGSAIMADGGFTAM
ncbi:SDR family NAD(P)-dependent oxidoreductase [Nocardia sp. IFM 10818]